MEEVSLHTLLCKQTLIVGTVFPEDGERKLSPEVFKERIEFEESSNSSKAKDFFDNYLMEISERCKRMCTSCLFVGFAPHHYLYDYHFFE